MKQVNTKITRELFDKDSDRYILVSGTSKGAPLCPYGNHFKWVGYDLKEDSFVRFTKSVYQQIVKEKKIGSTTEMK